MVLGELPVAECPSNLRGGSMELGQLSVPGRPII